jgi:hypothetical protein
MRTSRRSVVAIVCGARLVLFERLRGDAPWQSLFDGESLDSWIVRGGYAKYADKDGSIVGRAAECSSNTFFCTEKEYGDFVLECDVKFDPVLDSGCQIRSHFYRRDTLCPMWRDGRKIERIHEVGDVYGYQVEISNAAGAASGGTWDEAPKDRRRNRRPDPGPPSRSRCGSGSGGGSSACGARPGSTPSTPSPKPGILGPSRMG